MYEQRYTLPATAEELTAVSTTYANSDTLSAAILQVATSSSSPKRQHSFKRLPKRLLLLLLLCFCMIFAYFRWNNEIEHFFDFENVHKAVRPHAPEPGYVNSASRLRPTQQHSEELSIVLEREVRVLCWVMTTPNYHRTRADYVVRTWGKRCNRLVFITSEPDDKLDTVILDVEDKYDVIWGKTKMAFKYMWEHYRDECDWFMKADDDTFVFVENLRYMLYPYSPQMPIYFGYNFRLPGTNTTYMSGGSGYVLSKEALHRFVTIALKDPSKCRSKNDNAEDIEMGVCLTNIGVMHGDSRDNHLRMRFHPMTPFNGILSGYYGQDFWFFEYSYYNPRACHDCMSEYPVAFHYVNAEEMLMYDFFTNEFNVHGSVPYIDTVLPEKIDPQHYKVPDGDNIILNKA